MRASHVEALDPVTAGDIEEIRTRAAGAIARLAGRTVLVTGGEGFLPSYLVDALLAANDAGPGPACSVICMDNRATADPSRLSHREGRDDFRLVIHDVTEPVDLDGDVDVVVHAASIASPTWYRERPLETIDVNVTGTRRMLDLARDRAASRFVLFSSSEIYGDPPPDRVPTAEDYWGHVSCTGPRACYDESKRLGETLATTYHRLHGLPVTIVRPFNVYGPRLRLDDRRVVPDFVRDALESRPITVHSDGRVTRSFCYVTDAAVAILGLLAGDAACEAYNVGNDEEVSIGELAEIVDELSGNGLGVRYEVSDDPAYLVDNPSRRAPDLGKLRAALDWEPRVSLREGIARTLAAHQGGGA
jgi:dTDP-glucose 4,6-dehydratase/UDP-glucuronate decarboxylase